VADSDVRVSDAGPGSSSGPWVLPAMMALLGMVS
jgi:hypothetical protein